MVSCGTPRGGAFIVIFLVSYWGALPPRTPRMLGGSARRLLKSRPRASRYMLCYTMVYHGTPWYTMVYHGILWYTMVYHGIPWYTMVWHGIPLYTMVYHGIPWYTMEYHGDGMEYHGIPWNTMECHRISRNTTWYHDGMPPGGRRLTFGGSWGRRLPAFGGCGGAEPPSKKLQSF